jgi:hypothetical protein
LDVFFNGQNKESIPQYNQVCNMVTNLTLDPAQKWGMGPTYGYGDANGALVESFSNQDSRVVGLNEVGSYSGLLLGSCLSNSAQLLPAFAMGTIRVIFTIDSIANMFANTTGFAVVPTAYSLYNFELVYTVIKFPQEYMDRVNRNEKIYLKTMSFYNTSNFLPSGTTGTVSLVYNQRATSMKSIFVHCSGTATTSGGKQYDAFDITTGNGDYQLTINGVSRPQKPISMLNNIRGSLMTLRQAIGALYNPSNSMSIMSENLAIGAGTQTDPRVLQKSYIGFPLEKLHLITSMMSGISTANQPITLTINLFTATPAAVNVNMIILYDMILEIDMHNHQVNTIV